MFDRFSNSSLRVARGFAAIALLGLACAGARSHAAPPAAASVLYLHDGDFLAGRLDDCEIPNVVRWQTQGFAQPFEFPSGAFRAAYFPAPAAPCAPAGAYCFELSAGDVLYGNLASVTPEQIEIESAQFGKLRVPPAEINRLSPSGESSASDYRGPSGLVGWHVSAENDWSEEAGRLITTTRHAEVRREFKIPEQARIEFEIAWNENPEFTFVLAAGVSNDQLQAGYRFEVWDHKLVLVRSGKTDGDVAFIYTLNSAADHVHLAAFYDQNTGRLSVYAIDGREVAEVAVLERKGTPLRVVSLTNLGSGVRLERLNISRWNGQSPADVDADQPRVQLTDGTIVYGDLIGYQPESKQFIVRAEGEEKHIDAAQLACVTLTHATQPVASSYRVDLHDGGRVSGDVTKVAGGKLYISRHGIEEPLVCAVTDVRSLVGLDPNYQRPAVENRLGRIEFDGVRSHGTLVKSAAVGDGAASCLVWQPQCSTTDSPLDRNASGRIVYRDPPAAPRKLTQRERELERIQRQPRPQLQPVGLAGAMMRVLSGGEPGADPAPLPRPHGTGIIYLQAGDRIPAEVSEIDEEGVHFSSPVVASTFAPLNGVNAVEFVPDWTAAALDDVKRQRLLTLPRMQKGNPPTHLIVSTSGDYLRTRLTAMNKDTLTIESHLETKQIPRDRVACIIWLHQTNAADTSPPDADEPASALQVQAIQTDGVRLTFVPDSCTGKLLSGMSKVLGDCHLDLNSVDALVLGGTIGSEAAGQAFQLWKLTDAVEPRYLRDAAQGNTEGHPAGAESGLVGKSAPDIRLELLEGGRFNLADQKGHIVVLDFWASWCGPCMQAMPQVDSVVEEFADRGVKLVAVNMQEDHAAASSALERLKIHPAVALDVDGAAAEHYQVTAIPQTVVIDADGNVAQVFIGSGLDLATQLRGALTNLLPQDSR